MESTPSTPKPATLGVLLHEATRAIRKAFEGRVGSHGLSSAQWRLLLTLGKCPEGASQARLADHLEIEPISVSRLIDRMEASGWVERRPCPADRRAKIVKPTARARAAHAEIRAIAEGIYAEALAGLPPETRQALTTALIAIIANLNEADARPDDQPAATVHGGDPE